jgi:hypothetical protein
MGGVERRELLKATVTSGIALAIGGAPNLLVTNEARATSSHPQGWPNRRLLDLARIDHPIIQAPMGGAVSPEMPVAVSGAGGLGSFPCSWLPPAQLRDAVGKIRSQTAKPVNLNFFAL